MLENGTQSPWPPYDVTNKHYLLWKYPMTSTSVGERLRERQCDFWHSFIPNLVNAIESVSSNQTSHSATVLYDKFVTFVLLFVNFIYDSLSYK